MAYTKTGIINFALIKAAASPITGAAGEINSSPSAQAMQILWDFALTEVLRGYEWKFAIKRARLEMLALPPAYGFICQYAAPADVITPLEIVPWSPDMGAISQEYLTISANSSPAWKWEGGRVLTNYDAGEDGAPPLYMRYVARPEDSGIPFFEPLFVKALVLKLASDAAAKLSNHPNLYSQLLKEYEDALTEARLHGSYGGTEAFDHNSHEWTGAGSVNQFQGWVR